MKATLKRGLMLKFFMEDTFKEGGHYINQHELDTITKGKEVEVLKVLDNTNGYENNQACVIYDPETNTSMTIASSFLEFPTRETNLRVGKKTVMSTLEVGTKFYVCNGGWDGEIVDVGQVKHLKVCGADSFLKDLSENPDYTLWIKIKE